MPKHPGYGPYMPGGKVYANPGGHDATCLFTIFGLREFTFSNSEDARLVRNQANRDTDASAYVFFPGCRMGSSNPEYVMQTYRYLTAALKGGVGIAVACCGAPAEWSGKKSDDAENMPTLA